jgi:hypothetical protein
VTEKIKEVPKEIKKKDTATEVEGRKSVGIGGGGRNNIDSARTEKYNRYSSPEPAI